MKNDRQNKLKDLENDLNNYNKLQKYNKIKSELEEIYEKFVEGAKVRNLRKYMKNLQKVQR